MTRGIILKLIPQLGFDFTRVVEDISNKRPVDLSLCEVSEIPSVVHSFRGDFIEYIGQHGLTSLINEQLLEEAVVKPGAAATAILSLLHAHLAGLSVTTDMVIVDPYFFASTSDTSYPQLIHDALKPVLATLRSLKVVTLPNKVDQSLLAQVNTLINQTAPSVAMIHATSKSFHDRFWINPNKRTGFICGTSLNGLGKRYALIDRMQSRDVADISVALRNEGVL